MSELKKTPLNNYYQEVGAKLVDFGGWEMPVQFTSIIEEHKAVREDVGIFDVSHMGEIRVTGNEAVDFLNYALTNDVSKLKVNRAQYTTIANEKGGVIDDLLIYKLDENEFFLVPNAGNKDTDYEWLIGIEGFDVEITDESDDYAVIAIQGPNSREMVQKHTDEDISEMKMFNAKQDIDLAGHTVLLSQSGYTGEDGFEIYMKPDSLEPLWKVFKEDGAAECGLGARDTLRLEAGLPLHGQDLSPEITPIEARIGFAVNAKKEKFIGGEILKDQKENGAPRRLSAFEMTGKGIPRTDYEVYDNDGNKVGYVTSGTKSPSTGKAIGFALVDTDFYEEGKEFIVKVRKREIPAKFVKNFK
ncbi:glycine cleavage system aminomethyltransferase GcvT [Nosocomiicoccus ampullae]|uniref:glycine cleavage system aminomethyltransferase GcvT n=1 Tax=Nosocomiicoccus ampullae TaxID=489910 RepID=UPI001C5D0866|nr:glycine cleavage system aminomethyltransferase GcvT [Nosocomiicoccus ampullae]QYA49230.1 glycine cleavage system aminomethyltransferase GcvT [Nosocomiicoccus ampullae]